MMFNFTFPIHSSSQVIQSVNFGLV